MFCLDSLVSFNSLIYFHFSCHHSLLFYFYYVSLLFIFHLLSCFVFPCFVSFSLFSLVDDFSHFLVHQGSHVTPFIPSVDFDLDTLAWEVTLGWGLYIQVNDWSQHIFEGLCMIHIFIGDWREFIHFYSLLSGVSVCWY